MESSSYFSRFLIVHANQHLLPCSNNIFGGSGVSIKNLCLLTKVTTGIELLKGSSFPNAIEAGGCIVSKDCVQKEDVSAYLRA